MKWIEKKEDCKTIGDFEDYINTGYRKEIIKKLTYPFDLK